MPLGPDRIILRCSISKLKYRWVIGLGINVSNTKLSKLFSSTPGNKRKEKWPVSVLAKVDIGLAQHLMASVLCSKQGKILLPKSNSYQGLHYCGNAYILSQGQKIKQW